MLDPKRRLRKVAPPCLSASAVENFLSFGPRWQLDLRAPEGRKVRPWDQSCPMVSGAAAGADRGRCSDGEIELAQSAGAASAACAAWSKPGQRASLPVCRLAAPPRSDVAFAIEVFAQDALYRYELALRPEQVDAESPLSINTSVLASRNNSVQRRRQIRSCSDTT